VISDPDDACALIDRFHQGVVRAWQDALPTEFQETVFAPVEPNGADAADDGDVPELRDVAPAGGS
jgi:hypothetical protein